MALAPLPARVDTPRRTARRAAASLALALAAGCASGPHPVFRAAPLAAPAPPREAAARVLLLGDFGKATDSQRRVAAGIRRVATERPFDLALHLGDNLYACGPEPLLPGAETCAFGADGATIATRPPVTDPAFGVTERPLTGLGARGGGPLPVYLILGNHDVGLTGSRCVRPALAREEAERRRACLSVAHQGPAWTMPARHYVLDRGPLRIVAIDSNVAVRDYGGFTLGEELAFVREATAGCAEPGRVCFVAGHHPPAAAQVHGSRYRPDYLARLSRLLAEARGVRGFLGGHVHTLEHVSTPGLEVFISGSTAMAWSPKTFRRPWPKDAELRFATTSPGFAELEVAGDGSYRVRFVGAGGEALHCCEAGAEGPCRAVTCG